MAAVATAAAAARADTDTVTIMVAIGDGAVTTVMITPTTVNSTTIHRNNTTIRDFLPSSRYIYLPLFFLLFFRSAKPVRSYKTTNKTTFIDFFSVT